MKPTGDDRLAQRNIALHSLPERQVQALERDEENRIIAYTDGAACNPEDHRRRRAAGGVHYAVEHDYNKREAVIGELQTVYRAELKAVAHVLATATSPTRIVSDCLSVVNGLNDIIEGKRHNGKGDHADLWSIIQDEIDMKDDN